MISLQFIKLNQIKRLDMNDYIQKYGQNAIQAYKKTLRKSQSIQKHSPRKQEHLLPKQSISKKSLKSANRNASKTKLNHSKSIKNHKIQQQNNQCRKKGNSVIQNKKNTTTGYFVTNNSNGFSHTFNKNITNLNPANKKKLVINSPHPQISGCSTPMRLNLNKNTSQRVKQPRQFNQKQRDKVTERIHRQSSGHKDHLISGTQYKKRIYIQNRLQQTLTQKKTIKSLVKGIVQSFQILLSEDDKLKKMLFLFKEIIQKISNISQSYKNKFKRTKQRIRIYKDIQNAYLGNEQNTKTKLKLQKSGYSDHSDIGVVKTNVKKKQTIEMIILNQNYQLRKKIQKLQKQLEYYSTQQASLMNVFGRYKNSQSQLKIIDSFKQYDQNRMGGSQQQNNRNLSNRRSSENLFSYQQENHMLGVEKRLSFDPYQTNQFKNKYASYGGKKNINKEFQNKNQEVQELSEEENQQENSEDEEQQ